MVHRETSLEFGTRQRYGSSFVARLVVSKCLMVTPHYRLEQSLERTGMDGGTPEHAALAAAVIGLLFRRRGARAS